MNKRNDLFVIRCWKCGKCYGGVAIKKSDVRAAAEAKGWSVAIPEWAVQTPPVSREAWWQDHPRGKTVDMCPDCMTRGMREAVDRLEQHMKKDIAVPLVCVN
jgi:hypothetical protein